jgi:hypothetical protein
MALGIFVGILRIEGQAEREAAFVGSVLQLSKLAAWASTLTDDENGVAMSVLTSVLVVESEESETYKWANATAKTIASPELRQRVLDGLQRNVRRWRGEKIAGDYVGDTLWQIFRTWLQRGVSTFPTKIRFW